LKYSSIKHELLCNAKYNGSGCATRKKEKDTFIDTSFLKWMLSILADGPE
jgi:hypothetical protein